MHEKIIILDFGSQTTQLIGRRVRELNVYCEIVPYNKMPDNDPSVIGVILSGSPFPYTMKRPLKSTYLKYAENIRFWAFAMGRSSFLTSMAEKLSRQVRGSTAGRIFRVSTRRILC